MFVIETAGGQAHAARSANQKQLTLLTWQAGARHETITVKVMYVL